MDEETEPDIGHESRDLDPRRIALFAAALAAVVIFAAGMALLFEHYAAGRHAALQAPVSPLAPMREATPAPRLQVNGAEELRRMRAEEDAALHSYGWIDRERGIVRIPIEAAMQELAGKGLPVREEKGKSQK